MLPDRTMYHSNYLLTPLLQLLGRLLGLEPHVLLFPFAENSFHKPTSTAAWAIIIKLVDGDGIKLIFEGAK